MTTTRRVYNEHQTNIVNTVLDDFSFSTSPTELQQQILQIKAALSAYASKEQPYYWLGQCLLDPERYFQELVLVGLDGKTIVLDAGTIAEVKKFIIEELTKKMTLAIKDKNTLRQLGWDENEILSLCLKVKEVSEKIRLDDVEYTITRSADDKEEFFKRGMAELNQWENPYQPPPLEHRIYTRTISEELRYQARVNSEEIDTVILLSVNVKVKLSDKNIKKDSFFLDYKQDFDNPSEENKFIKKIIKLAEEKALDFATEQVLNYINVSRDVKNKIKKQTEAKQIITHEYYYALLKDHKKNAAFFLDIPEKQVINFTDEKLIRLVNMNLCNFTHLKLLSPAQYKVATHHLYYGMLLKQKKEPSAQLTMSEILQFNDTPKENNFAFTN